MMRAAVDVFWVIFVERLGSRAAFAAAGRAVERTGADAILTERRGAAGQLLSSEDREWLHRRPIP
jgi:hypothetical protein